LLVIAALSKVDAPAVNPAKVVAPVTPKVPPTVAFPGVTTVSIPVPKTI